MINWQAGSEDPAFLLFGKLFLLFTFKIFDDSLPELPLPCL